MHERRVALRPAILLAIAITLAACAPAASPGPAAKPAAAPTAGAAGAAPKPATGDAPGAASREVPVDEAPFSVGYIQGMLAIPVGVMQRLDLPKKYSLNVEFRQFGDPDVINDAWVLKQITVQPGMNVLIAGTRKVQTGYGLAIFPTFKATNKVVVPTASPLQSLADLRGQRVAVSSTTGGEFSVLKWILKSDYNLDILRDMDPRPVPPPVALQLLGQGDAAALMMFEPWASRAMFGGRGRVLADLQQEWQRRKGQPLWFSAIHVDDTFARAHPNAIKRYLMAYSEAVDYINRDSPDVRQLLREVFNLTDDADAQLFHEHVKGVFTNRWDDQTIAAIKEYMQIEVAEGNLPRVVDELFTREFAPAP
jgi:ABC-type nitrate/sulfonate/bicarbonate transport system substrate-binding protein